MLRKLERAFRLTIACSPAVAVAYRDFLRKPNDGRLAMICNGGHLRDEVPAEMEKAEIRQSLGIPDQAFVVSHIGRLFAGTAGGDGLAGCQKAQDILLMAFAQAFAGNTQCVLVLVGDGPLRGEAEALAHSLGVAEQTRFLGQLPEPWPALKAADLFCFPSRYEGLPNVLPEAASCGLPVVASDIPEIRFLYPGEAWLLKPVDDVPRFAEAMRLVREKQDEITRKAHAAAPDFRERFSMKACAEKYLQAYGLALNDK
jgi:glycosyltransferase involved in cell wall biosynthesis